MKRNGKQALLDWYAERERQFGLKPTPEGLAAMLECVGNGGFDYHQVACLLRPEQPIVLPKPAYRRPRSCARKPVQRERREEAASIPSGSEIAAPTLSRVEFKVDRMMALAAVKSPRPVRAGFEQAMARKCVVPA